MTDPARRKFLKATGRVAAGTALVGTTLGWVQLLTERGESPPLGTRGELGLLRPPGALDEDDFLARCVRCTRCYDACHCDAIRLFPSGSGNLSGTPYIVPEVTGCNLCLDCTEVCPTLALVRPETIENVDMGVAVVDERLCVSHNGTGLCGACHTVCPLKNRAISQDYRNAPTVDPEQCVGCGLCEEACIVEDRKAIRVVTERRWTTAQGEARRV